MHLVGCNAPDVWASPVEPLLEYPAELMLDPPAAVRQWIDLLPIAVYVRAAPSGNILWYNRRAVELWGRHPCLGEGSERFCGACCVSPLDGVPRPRAEAPPAMILRDGRPVRNREVVIERPDGTRIVVLVNLDAIVGSDGGIRGCINVFQDITEQKRAAERSAEQESRFRRAILEAPLPAMLRADDGEILEVNEVWTKLSGYTKQELPNVQEWARLAYGDGAPAILKVIASSSQHARVQFGPFAIRTAAGAERLWEFNAAQMGALPDGRTLTMCMAVDITERRSLEAQVLQSQKMEAVGRVAGGVAHDFNNLLTVISGYCSMLLAGKALPAGQLDQVNAIAEAAAKGATLTRQLLSFSRQTEGDADLQVMDLCAVLRETEQFIQPLIGEDIHVLMSVPGTRHFIRARPTHMQQVLMNLAVNGRDAMPGGGTLRISLEAEQPDWLTLTVADTGVGIEPGVLPKIFEPFFTTKARSEGTGLGLSTVYGIVTGLGGGISVTSQVGAGTAFAIRLPMTHPETEPEQVQAEVRCAEPAARRATTVLVIEDDEFVRKLATTVLRSAGYTVLAAGAPDEAVACCGSFEGRIDVVLSDVVMPGSSGPEVVEVLERMRPGIVSVFMSGYTGTALTARRLAKGVRLIAKPFTPQQLVRTIDEISGGNLHPE